MEIKDRGKYRQRETVPELTSCMHEGLGISVNSCIRELDRKGVRVCCQTGVTSTTQRRRDAIGKFRRAVTMVVAIEKRQRCNIAAEGVSERTGVDETKSL